jgi:tetratricopeptide (TPR) repeat protein
MKMKRNAITVFVLLPLLLLSCGAFWQSDSARAIQAARTGEYAAAVRTLEPLVAGGSNDLAAVESLYYSWIRQGEYARAKERFEAWATARPTAGPIRLAAGRINRVTGNYAAALTHLNAIQNAADVGMAASFEKAKVLEETGKVIDAELLYKKIVETFLGPVNAPRPPTNTPNRNLIYVAGALEATDSFQEAGDVYKAAVKADPQNAEAWVAWGNLFARKFKESDAIANYREALKIDPKMPEAHMGLVRTLASTEPEEEEAEFKLAIEVNPRLPEAHLYDATKQIESERYDKAMESVNKALAVNPQSADAFSVAATAYYLQGNTAEFNKYKEKVLSANPRYSKLYYTLAESAVSVRMYKQAVEFAREAIKINPKDWDSMTLLGINLQRIGQETEGTEVLEAAFAGDGYNTWAGNTLNLLDSFARGDFERFKTEHFEVKLHKKERAALEPLVKDLLEKAYRDLTAKYNFTPQGPLSFEMFPDHGDFEVRAVGLTGLGALGVCFGNLFVMDSPSAKELDHFNWGSTLWHEFAHIITLQMTDNKVPRWFSEGLSVFEERKAYPGWGDDMKLDNLKAIKGFPAIRNMLAQYKAGKTTEEVFKQALNVSLEAFDTDFLKWMDDRAAGIDSAEYGKLLNEGVAALEAGEADKAITALKKAVTMYPEYSDENNAYEPLAEAYLKKGDKAGARDTLKTYLNWSETAFPSYMKLADLLQESGDKAGAAKAIEGAMYVRPMDLQGHSKLGALLLDLKQYSGAAREYEAMIALKTPDRATAYYHLAQSYLGLGKKAEARRAIINSVDIAPNYEPAQMLLLEISK